MIRPIIKIGIAGTRSTGKSTFLATFASILEERGLKIGPIDDLARRAQSTGLSILTEHTFESTLWIMPECMRQEAEASLTCDVILVDRPVLDALGYLKAALEVTGSSGAGLIEVTLSGNGMMKAVKIDPSLVKPDEAEILEDLVLAAHNDARTKLETRTAELAQEMTGGLQLPPGMKLPF